MADEGSNAWNKEEAAKIIVDCAYRLYHDLGPGLLESVYEVVLARLIHERKLRVRRQIPIPISYAGFSFDEGFRADLIVEDLVIVEIKSVEMLAPVHSKQLLTYLRLLKFPLGILLNFGGGTFKECCKRIVNGPQAFDGSPLRVNQQDPHIIL